jgi:DNA-binding FrmR family transcriptional regulator
MTPQHYAKVQTSIKKVQGQINLINNMMEEKRYCVDIAQQVNAAIGLLKKINSTILESHLVSCGGAKLNSKDAAERQAFAEELIKAFTLNNNK